MGNCFMSKSPIVTNPESKQNLHLTKTIDGDLPNQLIVESIKKTQKLDDEKPEPPTDQGNNQISPNKEHEVKRNERKNIGKIKKADVKYDEKIYEHFVKVEKEKTEEDIHLIKNCFKKHFVFYNLSIIEAKAIIDKMFYCEVPKDEYVFQQGDNASSYLVIAKGQVNIIINNQEKKLLKKGDGFGEFALLYNAVRSASAKATENCGFWAIDRVTFKKAVEELVHKEYLENRKFIEGISFFNSMTSEQKDAIAGVLINELYTNDEYIVNEGDQASSFYIIKEGAVSIIKGKNEVRKMLKGESFGEQALYYKTTRQCSVKAINDVKVLALGRDTLIQILGDQVQIITFKNLQKWAYEKNKVLNKLTKLQIEKLCEAAKFVNHKAGEVIFEKGSLCSSKIIIVLEGALKKAKFNTIIAKKGELWGDEYLLESNAQRTYDDNIVMETDGVLAELTSQAFIQCIGGTLESILKKNEGSHEKKMLQHKSKLKEIGVNIKLEDLIHYKKLGSGQFGSVYLVKTKELDQFFALKCISKQQIIEGSLENHLKQEKAVLDTVNFPFIMQYIRSYKDDNFIYFLVEYIKGMELFDAIRNQNYLQTYEAQFYTGSLLLALEYLHSQGIIYRDLKPENVMVDEQGYLRLIDMGTAKFLRNKFGSNARTFTTIGTPHYMAPEIITNKGYTYYVDLWSLGVVLYEFMCGRVPFGEECEDPYEIYEEAATTNVKYPSFLRDKKARRIMDQLISKVPEVRLGGSYAALKAHPWFDDFDWDKLMDRQLRAPYIPPKEKMISDNEIRKMSNLGRKITDEINGEINKHSFKRYKKEQARDINWDKNF